MSDGDTEMNLADGKYGANNALHRQTWGRTDMTFVQSVLDRYTHIKADRLSDVCPLRSYKILKQAIAILLRVQKFSLIYFTPTRRNIARSSASESDSGPLIISFSRGRSSKGQLAMACVYFFFFTVDLPAIPFPLLSTGTYEA